MRHVILMNLKGHGYSTWAGDPAQGFEVQPLGIATERVSPTMLEVTSELNESVRGLGFRLTLSMRHADDGRPVVAFGCIVPGARDDLGRDGIVFVHGIELESPNALRACVRGMVEFLSASRLQQLLAGVAQAAVDDKSPADFITGYSRALQQRMARHPMARTGASVRSDLGAIEHDCAGGGTVAWLAAAHARDGASGVWSVRDVQDGKTVRTVLTPGGDGVVLASALLDEGLSTVLRPGGRDEPIDDAPTRALSRADMPPSLRRADDDDLPRGTAPSRWGMAIVGAGGVLAGVLVSAVLRSPAPVAAARTPVPVVVVRSQAPAPTATPSTTPSAPSGAAEPPSEPAVAPSAPAEEPPAQEPSAPSTTTRRASSRRSPVVAPIAPSTPSVIAPPSEALHPPVHTANPSDIRLE